MRRACRLRPAGFRHGSNTVVLLSPACGGCTGPMKGSDGRAIGVARPPASIGRHDRPDRRQLGAPSAAGRPLGRRYTRYGGKHHRPRLDQSCGQRADGGNLSPDLPQSAQQFSCPHDQRYGPDVQQETLNSHRSSVPRDRLPCRQYAIGIGRKPVRARPLEAGRCHGKFNPHRLQLLGCVRSVTQG